MTGADGGCVRVLCIEHVCAVVLRSTQGHVVYFRVHIPVQIWRTLSCSEFNRIEYVELFRQGMWENSQDFEDTVWIALT